MKRHHPDSDAQRRRRVVLITDAERSQDEQLRTRQIRYASMMGLRVVCLIVAGVLVSVRAPMLWLWIPLCLVGMVALPWMAVLIANDRLPRERHRWTTRLRGGRRDPDSPPGAVAATESDHPAGVEKPGHQALPAAEPRVIDAD